MTETTQAPLPRSGRRRRRVRRPLVVVLVVLVLAGLLGGAVVGGLAVLDRLSAEPAADYAGPGSGEVVVQVLPGETAAQVGARLAERDVVASALAFSEAAVANPDSAGLQPGTYALRAQMKASEALELLLSEEARVEGTVVVPEGFTVAQVLERVASATEIPLADLQAAAQQPASLGLPSWVPAGKPLEGLLFPATYTVEPGVTAQQVLSMMVDRFEQAAEAVDLVAGAEELGFEPYEILTIASLIEREVRFDDEYPRVAQVVYNRIEQGERIDIDAAVLYGLGRTSGSLTQSDLESDTPYNLRRIRGLPPTPISNPGEATLQGALNPSGGDELFYVLSTKEGRSTFTTNLRDHNEAVRKAREEGIF